MKVDAILCADLHLREESPICRTDDFMAAQIKKLQFIAELVAEYSCPLLIAGDVFDKPKSYPFVERIALEHLLNIDTNIFIIPGQHDLPAHNIKNYDRSSLSVIDQVLDIPVFIDASYHYVEEGIVIHGFYFGKKIDNKCVAVDKFNIALIHQMVHQDKKIHESMESTSAISLLKNNNFDLIVSGDNHQPFIQHYKGKLLVNCGSMMRTRADQADYKPAVWLWNKEKNDVVPAYLPIEENVVIRDHIDYQQKRDEKMETFVKTVKGEYEVSFSFKENIEKYFSNNKVRPGVKEEIYAAYEN